MGFMQQSINQGLYSQPLLSGAGFKNRTRNTHIDIKAFDWRLYLIRLQRRFPSAGLAGVSAASAAVLALMLAPDMRLLTISMLLSMIGGAGAIWHLKRRWDRFCDDVARQSYVMPWKPTLY